MNEPPIKTRQEDPDGYEAQARAQRRIDPVLWDWEAYYGKAGLRGRNVLLGALILAVATLGSIWYLGLRQEATIRQALAASADEHKQIVLSAQQMTCILALAQQKQLDAFMNDRNPDAWYKWCWWVRPPKPN